MIHSSIGFEWRVPRRSRSNKKVPIKERGWQDALQRRIPSRSMPDATNFTLGAIGDRAAEVYELSDRAVLDLGRSNCLLPALESGPDLLLCRVERALGCFLNDSKLVGRFGPHEAGPPLQILMELIPPYPHYDTTRDGRHHESDHGNPPLLARSRIIPARRPASLQSLVPLVSKRSATETSPTHSVTGNFQDRGGGAVKGSMFLKSLARGAGTGLPATGRVSVV